MARIIAVANQKGGVGKTTTCVNLSAALAAMRKRVLIVDLDPQGNATMASGVDKFDLPVSVCMVLLEDRPTAECIVSETCGAFDILPANEDLTAAEVALLNFEAHEFRLKNALAEVRDSYDYVFIDCPPSLNLLTVNAMCAADSILVPLQCEYFALEGLTLLIDTVDQLSIAVNPELRIEGILRTMFDSRNRLSTDVSEELKRNFGDLVYKTLIPRNVRLAEAPSFGKPVMYYDKSSVGAKAYLALAGEIIERESDPVFMQGLPDVDGAPTPYDEVSPSEHDQNAESDPPSAQDARDPVSPGDAAHAEPAAAPLSDDGLNLSEEQLSAMLDSGDGSDVSVKN